MQGQSEYTPTKQNHLRGLLKIGSRGWNPVDKPWAHDTTLIVDCTAGSGHSDEGEDGSPLIINRFFAGQNHPFRQLCCEQTPSSFGKLTLNDLVNTDLIPGRYQDSAWEWLEQQDVAKPALGFLYCDPNGAKDLLEGRDLFQRVSRDPRFARLDLIFHWSLTAYMRNFGANVTWANDQLANIINNLRQFKRYAIMREPVSKHQWVVMYLHNSDKINGTWRSEGFLPADEWIGRYLQCKGQQSLLGDDTMAGLTI